MALSSAVTLSGSVGFAAAIVRADASTLWVLSLDASDVYLDKITYSSPSSPSLATTTTQTVTQIHGTGQTTKGLHMAIDATGVIHVASESVGITGTLDIAYNTYTPGTNTWGTWEQAAEKTKLVSPKGVAIGIDENNKPHIAYINGEANMGVEYARVYYVNKTGASWSTPVMVSTGTQTNYANTRIVVGSASDILVLYTTGAGGDYYYREFTSSWGTETSIASGVYTTNGSPNHSDTGSNEFYWINLVSSAYEIQRRTTGTAGPDNYNPLTQGWSLAEAKRGTTEWVMYRAATTQYPKLLYFDGSNFSTEISIASVAATTGLMVEQKGRISEDSACFGLAYNSTFYLWSVKLQLTASATAASATSTPELTVTAGGPQTYYLTASATAASATQDVALLRKFATTASAAAASNTADVALGIKYQAIVSATAASATQDATLAITNQLVASATVTSATSDVALPVLRAATATATAASTTADAALGIKYAALVSATAASSTTDAVLGVVLPAQLIAVARSIVKSEVLPRYLLANEGTQYEDFETVGEWTANNGSVAANTSEFKTGTQSVKLTANAAATAFMTKTVNWDLSGDWGRCSVQYYQHAERADYNGSFHLQLSNDSSFTNYFRCWIANGKLTSTGWNTLTFAKASFAAMGSANWANPIVRVRLQFVSAAGKTPAISFDNLKFGLQGQAALLLSFDDGTSEQYDNCYAYMQPLDIRGTLWSDTSGIDQAGQITAAQLVEMDRANWIVGNHTRGSAVLGGQTEAAQEAQIDNGRIDLTAIGLTRGRDHLNFPSGSWDVNTVIAMTNLGILTGRTVVATLQTIPADQQLGLPWDNLAMLPSGSVTTQSLAVVEGYIDAAITYEEILTLHFHRVGTAGQMSTADFQTLMDYVRTKWVAGQITPITIDDLYRLMSDTLIVPSAGIELSVTTSLTASCAASSTTQDGVLGVKVAAAASANAASSTQDGVLGVRYAAVFAVTAASATADAALDTGGQTVYLTAACSADSATTASLLRLTYPATFSAAAASATQDAALANQQGKTFAASAISATTDAALGVVLPFTAACNAVSATTDAVLGIVLPATLSALAASVTNDATLNTGGQTLNLTASCSAASSTADGVLGIEYQSIVSASVVSSTPDIPLLVAQSKTVAASADSSTTDAALVVLRGVTASAVAATATSDVALAVLRTATASCVAESLSSLPSLRIGGVWEFAASANSATGTPALGLRLPAVVSAGATSTTPDTLLSVTQMLLAACNAATATSDAALLRKLATVFAATVSSVTSEPALNTAQTVYFTVSATAASATSTPNITLRLALAHSASAASSTPDTGALAVLRAVNAAAVAATATTTITLRIGGEWEFAATATSATTDAAMAVLRGVSAACAAATATTSITLRIAGTWEFAASAASQTADVALLRKFPATVNAATASATPDAALRLKWAAVVFAAAGSTTSDAVLGVQLVLFAAGSAATDTGAAVFGLAYPNVFGGVAESLSSLPSLIIPDIVGVIVMVIGGRAPQATAQGRTPTTSVTSRVPSVSVTASS